MRGSDDQSVQAQGFSPSGRVAVWLANRSGLAADLRMDDCGAARIDHSHAAAPLARLYGLAGMPCPFHPQSRRRTGNIAAMVKINRSEEHTSELQSLMRISYAVFCLKKKKTQIPIATNKHT